MLKMLPYSSMCFSAARDSRLWEAVMTEAEEVRRVQAKPRQKRRCTEEPHARSATAQDTEEGLLVQRGKRETPKA